MKMINLIILMFLLAVVTVKAYDYTWMSNDATLYYGFWNGTAAAPDKGTVTVGTGSITYSPNGKDWCLLGSTGNNVQIDPNSSISTHNKSYVVDVLNTTINVDQDMLIMHGGNLGNDRAIFMRMNYEIPDQPAHYIGAAPNTWGNLHTAWGAGVGVANINITLVGTYDNKTGNYDVRAYHRENGSLIDSTGWVQRNNLNPDRLESVFMYMGAGGTQVCYGNVRIYSGYDFPFAPNTPPPTVTAWTYPINASYIDNENGAFNWTDVVDGDGDPVTYQLYINLTGSQMDLVYDGALSNWTANFTTNGDYIYTVGTYDGEDYGGNSSIRNFTFDSIDPILTVTLPTNNTLYTASLSNITVDLTCSDLHLYILNYSFYNDSDILKTLQNGTTTGTEMIIKDTIDISSYDDGTYYLNVTCSDHHTNKQLEDLDWSYSDSTLTFFSESNPNKKLDLIMGYYLPATNTTAKFTSEETQTYNVEKVINKKSDRYEFGMDFDLPKDNFIFGYKVSKDNLKLINQEYAHFVLYNKYWLDFKLYFDDEFQTPSIIDNGNNYFIQFEIDWNSKGYFKNDRVSVLTKSIGGMNIVTETYTLIISDEYFNFDLYETGNEWLSFNWSTINETLLTPSTC